jgi:putative ATP-binding cassette transporter
MTLFELLKQETAGSRTPVFLIAGLSGIANAGLLAIINNVIQNPSADMQTFRSLLMYAVALALYAICFRYTSHKVTVVLEAIVNKLRVRIADKIRHTELLDLERIEQGEIFNLLTSETRIMSEASGILASAIQSSMLLIFAVIYLAMLSLPAFLLCVVLMSSSLWLYLHRLKEVQL